ncbi:protein extra-macrochaetae-like [Musca domestica]|uniref:Protein extra-macrochaetae-like n=1 Tax=Musca domestica TaxID=7370 RepID=A0ABM3V846_MUSDO|nr:protein extra-macrochaetae-like [Musca domestica]
MKSLTAVCQTGASMPAINPNGRISRHPPHRGDGENAEMKMYLSKLKDLVPFMPKNRKLSKLEIIQHVIDYICDLQSELETHPEINNFDASAALSFAASSMQRVSSGSEEGGADEDMAAEEEEEDSEVQQRLSGASTQQQQHQSSPAAQRQPLVDRPTPNTILPPASQQQQQRHLNNALTTVSTSPSAVTVTSSSSPAFEESLSSSASSHADSTNHTISDEKDVDSRLLC